MSVDSQNNRVIVADHFSNADLYYAHACLHRIVEKQGYSDVELDFRNCRRAFPVPMLPFCVNVLALWSRGIDVYLRLPDDETMRRLFVNTNWAFFMDHRGNAESRYRGITHSPAIRFSTGPEQNAAVNKAMDVLLAAIKDMTRDELRYFEWLITEITDNVINHAESPVGGLLQITKHGARNEIEIVVSDAGLSIPRTLKPAVDAKLSDAEVLQVAIQEGVTRDKSIGQGNGLYGSWRISQISGGAFGLYSGYASLESPRKNEIRARNWQVPVTGSTVHARIGYAREVNLSEVMIFPKRALNEVDYIETHFDEDADGNIVFDLGEESNGYGSRVAGRPVRRKLENLLTQIAGSRVRIDLSDVKMVSSSYADEVFGKLFKQIGPIQFMNCIVLENVDPLVRGLIDRAITQRMSEPPNAD